MFQKIGYLNNIQYSPKQLIHQTTKYFSAMTRQKTALLFGEL